MIGVEISVDTASLERRLNKLERSQLPFASALAINDVMAEVADAEPAALERELDRPTPFTKRRLFIRRASKRRLSGEVGHKDAQASYLKHQARGGVRRAKSKAVVVPVAQRLNKYGNMPRGSLKRALAKPNVFSGKVNGVAGIWQAPKRRGGGGSTRRSSVKSQGVKLLAVYKDSVTYRPRVKFEARGRALVSKRITPLMAKRLAAAVRSAR